MDNSTPVLRLESRDLISMEDRLCRLLEDFFSFSAHALYFPMEKFPEQAELLPQEKRLILPLSWHGANLGVLLLNGVKMGEVRRLLPHLPAIVRLCLENLGITRAARYEKRSGLLSETALFEKMETEAAALRLVLEDPGQAQRGNLPLHRLCFGLVVLKLNQMKPRRDDFYERFFTDIARACAACAPSDALCARLGLHEGRYEIGMLFSATGRSVCQKLAREALARMREVRLSHAEEGMHGILSAGHALYPQDMDGHELALPIFEQVRKLRDRARLAAVVAIKARYGSVPDLNLNMPFCRVLHEGGIVLESLSGGRIKTSLGRESNAKEGMRFHVFARGSEGRRGNLKGEVALMEVSEKYSLAEILYLEDAAAMPAPGDNLAKVDTSRADAGLSHPGEQRVPAGLFAGHGEFLRAYGEARGKCRKFVLAIVRIGIIDDLTPLLNDFEELIRQSNKDIPLAGRYGSNSLIFFHPEKGVEECRQLYEQMDSVCKKHEANLAAGLAAWPYLDFARSEMEECALKALEYGILLPAPHIGEFCSLAINISADRRYSLGDIFGAITEYSKALLADPQNAMARNSLGVCMTSQNRHGEAKRLFLEALKQASDNNALAAKICYNLGTVALALGETREALRHWQRCASLAPEHGYASIRLGQLYERMGRKREARASFEKALQNEDAVVAAAGRRHLAGMAQKQRKSGNARELLHEALLANPGDASAMLMLAGIYQDDNEDPSLVELLARKSARLTDKPEAWSMLASALRRLGREEEAREAELHARMKSSGAAF